jgi:site-specific recombinase XerC
MQLSRLDATGLAAKTKELPTNASLSNCKLLKLDGALYSTHSIRRTKPAHLYAKTKNLAAVKELLGHANVAAIGVYLGVTSDDARALAKQFPI